MFLFNQNLKKFKKFVHEEGKPSPHPKKYLEKLFDYLIILLPGTYFEMFLKFHNQLTERSSEIFSI